MHHHPICCLLSLVGFDVKKLETYLLFASCGVLFAAAVLGRNEVPDRPLLGLKGTAMVSRRRLVTRCLRCCCDSGPVALPVLYSDANGPVILIRKQGQRNEYRREQARLRGANSKGEREGEGGGGGGGGEGGGGRGRGRGRGKETERERETETEIE